MDSLSSSNDIRWIVVEKIYSRLQRLAPGSKEAEIIEHALSLALSIERQPINDSFFFHDILRNARHSIHRTQTRHIALMNKLTKDSARAAKNAEYKTPEANCIAREIETQLRRAAALEGLHAVRCLDGMLRGESIAETAAACGISPRSVNRARHKIRKISLPLFSS